MAEIAAIASTLTSLKAAGDIAKSFLDLKDVAKIQAKTIELQSVILAAQSGALAAQASERELLDGIRELEEQIAQMKAWEAEKERYQLEEMIPGVTAYHIKEAMRGAEPDHWICPACYQHGRKSILHDEHPGLTNSKMNCPECKEKYAHFY